MAGSISGYSGRNSLGLQAEFLSRYLERGFDLVADCLLNATFSDGTGQGEANRYRRPPRAGG